MRSDNFDVSEECMQVRGEMFSFFFFSKGEGGGVFFFSFFLFLKVRGEAFSFFSFFSFLFKGKG